MVFTVDIRSPEQGRSSTRCDARIEAGIETICEALGVGFEIEQVGHFDPVTFDQTLRQGACARPPKSSATRTWTSSRAPATTPAGSTASRRP